MRASLLPRALVIEVLATTPAPQLRIMRQATNSRILKLQNACGAIGEW